MLTKTVCICVEQEIQILRGMYKVGVLLLFLNISFCTCVEGKYKVVVLHLFLDIPLCICFEGTYKVVVSLLFLDIPFCICFQGTYKVVVLLLFLNIPFSGRGFAQHFWGLLCDNQWRSQDRLV